MVRQYTQLVALMDNWSDFQKNYNTALTSEGELQRQADIYAESWEAARDRVMAAREDVYDSLVNDDFYIKLDNAMTPILTGIATAIDAAGGLSGVLNILGNAIMGLYSDKIAGAIDNMMVNLGITIGYEEVRARLL